ncbi:MAG TPA: hypothetical protein PK941_14300, partial [Paludibacter sp.]|nr:hypothetical protein [Paludibacter sp.]
KNSTVETLGTRTQKTWNPPSPPMVLQELPYSEQDMAKATPEEARRMSRENQEQRLANQRAHTIITVNAFIDASKHYEGIKKQLEGTTFGRQMILAVDKFASIAGEYFDSDCIEFFHRMDMDEGGKEAYLKDMKTSELVTAPYFIKLVFDDPRVETGKVNMNGQEIKMTKMIQTISYSVQALSGKVITSGNVKKEKINRNTNVVVTEGVDDNMLIDLMEEALAEVAKRINKFFVAKASIKLIGPKKDDDFDPEAATIEIDGTQYDADEEFTIMKGDHTIIVDLDGFEQRGSKKFAIKKDGVIKISLRKVKVAAEQEPENAK